MGFSYWFRVCMMILAFVGTVLVIREVNRPGGPRGAQLLRALGKTESSAFADVNLCPTRVTRLEFADGRIIRQDGMTWVSEDHGQTRALDQVAVEKWFAAYCRTEGRRVPASADVKTVLRVEFVSGEPAKLIRSAGGEFEWMGQPFASEVMPEALRQLEQL